MFTNSYEYLMNWYSVRDRSRNELTEDIVMVVVIVHTEK